VRMSPARTNSFSRRTKRQSSVGSRKPTRVFARAMQLAALLSSATL
jgi:hypothetical protein